MTTWEEFENYLFHNLNCELPLSLYTSKLLTVVLASEGQTASLPLFAQLLLDAHRQPATSIPDNWQRKNDWSDWGEEEIENEQQAFQYLITSLKNLSVSAAYCEEWLQNKDNQMQINYGGSGPFGWYNFKLGSVLGAGLRYFSDAKATTENLSWADLAYIFESGVQYE